MMNPPPNTSQSSARYEGDLTVKLTGEDWQKLRRLAAMLGVSENEAIRKAIATELFIRDQLLANSKILLAAQGEKNLREIEFR
jgi:hypothetical protein